MVFATTYRIANILRNLLLFMFWMDLRPMLMPMVGVLSKLGRMLLVLALPHRHCVAPYRLLEMEIV
jgi:hypothetical protein